MKLPDAVPEGTIMRLWSAGKKGQRLRIEFDSGESVTLPRVLVAELGWKKGTELDRRETERYRRMGRYHEALGDAHRLLSFRQRARAEMERRLARKGHEPEVVSAVVSHLCDQGQLNDSRMSRAFARDRINLNPRGRRLIELELRKRGVSTEVARKEVAGAFSDEEVTEYELALPLARKWVSGKGQRALERHGYWKTRQRLYAFLARKGFPFATISRVSEDVLPRAEHD